MSIEMAWKLVEKGEKALDAEEYERALLFYCKAYEIFQSRKKKRALREISFTMELLAQKLRELAIEFKKGGEYEHATSCIARAMEAYSVLGKKDAVKDVRFEMELMAVSLRDEARTHRKEGRYREAIRNLNLSLGLCRRAGDKRCEALTLLELSMVHACMNRKKRALKLLDTALTMLSDYNEPESVLEAILFISQKLAADDALLLLERARKIAKDHGLSSWLRRFSRASKSRSPEKSNV